jgi:hypothetical protein
MLLSLPLQVGAGKFGVVYRLHASSAVLRPSLIICLYCARSCRLVGPSLAWCTARITWAPVLRPTCLDRYNNACYASANYAHLQVGEGEFGVVYRSQYLGTSAAPHMP